MDELESAISAVQTAADAERAALPSPDTDPKLTSIGHLRLASMNRALANLREALNPTVDTPA